MNLLSSVIISFLYGIACTGLGLIVLKKAVRYNETQDGFSASVCLATCFFLGQGTLVALWTFLSLCGWFSPPVITVVLLLSFAGLFAGKEDIGRVIGTSARLFKHATAIPLSWKIILILILLVVLQQAASCFLPVTGDAAAFYMVLPKVMASSHRLLPLAGYELMTAMGLFGEFHFAALMSLAGPDAAKLFVFWTALATLLFIVLIGRRVGLGWRGHVVCAIILFTSTAFTLVIGDGKVDLFGASLAVVAYYWALETGGRNASRTLFLTGVFTGLAIIAKLTYLSVLLPGIFLIVAWRSVRILSGRAGAVSLLKTLFIPLGLLLFCIVIGLVPMVAKNMLLFHAPFAPFYGIEGGILTLPPAWFSPEATRWIVLTYPMALTFGSYPWQYGNVSPVALALCPLILWIPRASSLLKSRHVQVTLAALAGLAIWICLKPSVLAPRYFLAPLLILSLPIGAAVDHIVKSKARFSWLRAVTVASLMLVLFLSFLQFWTIYPLAKPYLRGNVSECDYVGQPCTGARVINSEAKGTDRVFLLTYYTYFLRPDILQHSGTLRDIKNKTLSVSQTWEELYSLGFRYIFIDGASYAAWDRQLSDLSQRPSSLSVETIFHAGTYSVHRISSRDAAGLSTSTSR